ncbi:MAG: CehA/McbA family metallohydrolase, partial [Verrucomicrobiota bacterium]
LKSKVRDLNHYYLNDWIADQIHLQGGLYGHTHVGAKALSVEREMALFTPLNIVDFNSIMQASLNTDYFYDFLNLGYKMTASAGTDTPYGGTVGAVRLYADCGTNAPFTPDAWFNALKDGHTFVTTGPMVDFKIETARPGDTIAVTNDRPLEVKIHAWGLRGASAPLKLQLVQFGKVIQEISATSENQTELELTTAVAAGHGSWLTAHVVGRNRSEAVTTPVYVVRHGFRFWDVNQASALMQKELAVLEDIEKTVSAAVVQSGHQPLDYWNRWPAEQAAALRERVANVRETYQELERKLSQEVSERKANP